MAELRFLYFDFFDVGKIKILFYYSVILYEVIDGEFNEVILLVLI